MQLALTDLFRAKWTMQIHEEWMGKLLENRGMKREKLERIRDLINASVRDCLVKGYEPLIKAVLAQELPDPDDAHVIAAAIHSRADMIVTKNTKDFPASVLDRHHIEAQHPDEFIMNQMDFNEPIVVEAARLCRMRLKNPPCTVADYLKMLERNELPETVSRLREFAHLLS